MKINKKKNSTLATTVLLVILIAGACKKSSIDDAIPVVSIKSVSVTATDSAIITGSLVNQGAASVKYEGICYGIDSMPDLTENQHFIQGNQSDFSFTVPVKHDSTYFIRAFAANTYGYALTKPTVVKVP